MNISISEPMKDIFAVGSALLVLVCFAVWHPTGDFVSSPSYWVDEAVSVEKARNFLTYGVLDVAVAPGVLSGKPYATAAAGPLLTLPLAGFFSLFGIGIMQARLYMLLWLILLLCVSYFLVRNISGRRAALCAVLLLATFSPLYANGKTATGDIPGFVALLLALYYLYIRKWYLFSGMLLGIATTTKPSLYIPLIAVAIFEIVFSEHERRIHKAAVVVGGAALILVPWLISLPSHPLVQTSWEEVYVFFQNPFPSDATPVFGVGALFHSTVLQYMALVMAALFGVWRTRGKDETWIRFVRFAFLYALAAFVLYLRSRSWLRYLLSCTLLLFLSFPQTIQMLLHQRAWRYRVPSWTATFVLIMFIGAQAVHLFFFSWRTASDASMRDSTVLESIVQSRETVGFIDAPALASLFDSRRKYQVIRISGNTIVGESPLAVRADMLPDYVFIPYNRFGDQSMRDFVDPYTNVLKERYMDYTPPDARFSLYKKIP